MINYKVIPLGEILNKEYDVQLIEQAFKEFSCQRETDLENFLIQKAIPYEKTTRVFNVNITYANPVWDEKERRDLVKALKENKELEKQVRVIISEIVSSMD